MQFTKKTVQLTLPLIAILLSSMPTYAGWERFEIDGDVDSLFDLSFIDDSIGMALTDGSFDYQILYTTNGGLDWTVMSTSEDGPGTSGSDYARVHLITAMEGYLIPIHGPFADLQDLLHTTNAGASFDPIESPFDPPQAGHFFDTQDFWLSGSPSDNAMVAHTTDGGLNWATKETPISFTSTDLWFLDHDHGWIIGSGGNVLRTSDGGETWEAGKYESSLSARTVRFADPLRGWLVGEEGMLMATVDGGANWVQILEKDPDTDYHDLEVLSSDWVMATGSRFGESIVLVTQDGGVNWFRENTPDVGSFGPLARGGDTLFSGGGDDPAVVVGSGPRLLLRRKVGTMQSPTIKAVPPGPGVVGRPYEHQVEVYEGAPPYNWSLAEKGAPGISIDPSTGLVSGTPANAGSFPIGIQVMDSNGAMDSWSTSIVVAQDPLSFARPNLPSATHRLTYRASVGLEGGNPPYAAEVVSGELPYGMTVDDEGVVAGVPQDLGTFPFSVRFSDSSSPASSIIANLSITVDPLLEGRWEVQHAHNRIMDIHFFDKDVGIAIGWAGIFYDTIDGGKTWNHRLFEPGGQMTSFDWIGDEGWMTSSDVIYHSVNRGRTWESQGRPLFTSREISFFDANHGCAAGSGVAYTEDGGKTWTPSDVPNSSFVFSVDFASQTHVWAGGDEGLFMKSTDGGKSWTTQSLPEIGIAKSNGMTLKRDGSVAYYPDGKDEKGNVIQAQVSSVFFLNDQEGWVGTNLLVATQTTRMYHTVDGGQTWENQTLNRQVAIYNIQFLEDGLTGFASGLFAGRMWRTTNGGQTWASTNLTGSGDTFFWGMEFLDADTGWLLYHLNGDVVDDLTTNLEGSIWKTEDGARSFFKQYGWEEETNTEPTILSSRSFGPDVYRIQFFDPVNGVAFTKAAGSPALQFELYRTKNAGATWRRVGTAPLTEDLTFLDEDHVWGYGASESFDGGENWIGRPDVFPSSSGKGAFANGVQTIGTRLFFLDDRHGWLRTVFSDPENFFQKTVRIQRTLNGGATWEVTDEQVGDRDLELFFVDEQIGYRFAPRDFRTNVIERTTDGGYTWEPVYQREVSEVFWEPETLCAPNSTIGWLVGENGIAARQIAGSTEWEEVLFPPNWVLQDIEFNTCSGGVIVGGADRMDGPPIILQSTDENFTTDDRVFLPIRDHELRSVEILDSGNIYAYGGFGIGLKYAGPTNSLAIDPKTLVEGREGSAYDLALSALNGTDPLAWQICTGRLPEGLSFSAAGEISGTPTESGDFPLVIAVSDGSGSAASKRYRLRILPEVSPSIQPQTLPNGQVGAPYAVLFEASGTSSPYSWRLQGGNLPPGLDLVRLGFFGGVPQVPGTYEFEVEVRDGQSPTGRARKLYSLTIEGEVDPGGGPCDDDPLFCLARDWKSSGTGLESDRTGDDTVDAKDLILILGAFKSGW